MKIPCNHILSDHWKVISSEHISQEGQFISSGATLTENWIPAKVPSTILGTLVKNEIYQEPYFGENLKLIPKDQFKVPWWYITSFQIDQDIANLYARLCFDGINYKANVWLNGRLVAEKRTIDGAYRRSSFDVTDVIQKGDNVMAIEIIPPKPGDFSTGFVDWNPAPPDGNMGIFRPVTLKLHRGVRIENPFVRTKIDFDSSFAIAKLSVSAELLNDCDHQMKGVLIGKIGKVEFEKPITLAANSERSVLFTSDDFPELIFHDPHLWWPYHLGEPYMYDLNLQFVADDQVSSNANTRFGVREVNDYWLNEIHRGYEINGIKVLIKGAGWTDDLLLMDTPEKIEAQIRYVKHMNLNCIRLEGFWGKDQCLYDLCDQQGILLMVGWSCHWEHEIHMGIPVSERFGAVYKPKDVAHIAKAWEEQLIWLRNHPSIFVWTVASDKVPITELEGKYIETFAKYDPDRPYLNSTGGVGSDQHVIGSEDVISEISGSSGVKMLGPYDYTAPSYWFTDTKFGGAYGFNTETGPGAQVPQLDSLRKFIPKDKLWPINEVWSYHCALYEFSSLDRFTQALSERYGTPESVEEFDKKAQAMNYELMRPMFEAFQVFKKSTTGVIQWMLNGAWPKMYWQLYDYYLNPTGAFYATKKACAPLQLMYNYGNHQIYAVNDHNFRIGNLKARIQIYDHHSKMALEEIVTFDAEPDSAVSILQTEVPENISSTYFIDLRLYNERGVEINNNFYWLSTKEEILDYGADVGEFAFHTPSKQYADYRLLNHLPKVVVEDSYVLLEGETENEIEVTLTNKGDSIAFLINLKLIDENTGELVLPVFWEDNFLSLLPGEIRTLRATFGSGIKAILQVEGWNIE